MRGLAIKIQQREEQANELESIAQQTRSLGYDRIRSNHSQEDDSKARLIDVKTSIGVTLSDYVMQKDIIIAEIQMLDNPKYVELLYHRYIDFMRLEEIACVMKKSTGAPYSYDHIRAMHVQALRAFEARFPEKFNKL